MNFGIRFVGWIYRGLYCLGWVRTTEEFLSSQTQPFGRIIITNLIQLICTVRIQHQSWSKSKGIVSLGTENYWSNSMAQRTGVLRTSKFIVQWALCAFRSDCDQRVENDLDRRFTHKSSSWWYELNWWVAPTSVFYEIFYTFWPQHFPIFRRPNGRRFFLHNILKQRFLHWFYNAERRRRFFSYLVMVMWFYLWKSPFRGLTFSNFLQKYVWMFWKFPNTYISVGILYILKKTLAPTSSHIFFTMISKFLSNRDSFTSPLLRQNPVPTTIVLGYAFLKFLVVDFRKNVCTCRRFGWLPTHQENVISCTGIISWAHKLYFLVQALIGTIVAMVQKVWFWKSNR